MYDICFFGKFELFYTLMFYWTISTQIVFDYSNDRDFLLGASRIIKGRMKMIKSDVKSFEGILPSLFFSHQLCHHIKFFSSYHFLISLLVTHGSLAWVAFFWAEDLILEFQIHPQQCSHNLDVCPCHFICENFVWICLIRLTLF